MRNKFSRVKIYNLKKGERILIPDYDNFDFKLNEAYVLEDCYKENDYFYLKINFVKKRNVDFIKVHVDDADKFEIYSWSNI